MGEIAVETDGVFSLRVVGHGFDRVRFRAGQYFVVRALTLDGWMHGHPFSVSAAPNGRSIQAKGITPDIIVEDPTSPTAGRLREADLEKHLLNEQDQAAPSEKAQKTSVKPGVEADEKPPAPLEFASDKDFQFQQALKFLKGQPLATAQSAPPAPAKN